MLDEYDRVTATQVAEQLEFVLHHAGRGLQLGLVDAHGTAAADDRYRAAGAGTESVPRSWPSPARRRPRCWRCMACGFRSAPRAPWWTAPGAGPPACGCPLWRLGRAPARGATCRSSGRSAVRSRTAFRRRSSRGSRIRRRIFNCASASWSDTAQLLADALILRTDADPDRRALSRGRVRRVPGALGVYDSARCSRRCSGLISGCACRGWRRNCTGAPRAGCGVPDHCPSARRRRRRGRLGRHRRGPRRHRRSPPTSTCPRTR
ncbi:hypothetical protein SGLAM104S_08047 [Streptomyces glaucescens]